MKFIVKNRSLLRKPLASLFVLILLVYTAIPYTGAKAAGEIGINVVTKMNGINFLITEERLKSNTDNIELILTLANNQDWAHDFASTGKDQLVVNSMEANIDKMAWDTYKNKLGNISVKESLDYKTLTISLKNDSTFSISNNQTISMNLSAALVENWEGTVAPVSFTIYAQPEISIGGSIMTATTNLDLAKGGKTLDLNLLNASWNQNKITQLGGLNQILNQFYAGTDQWKVAQYLKLQDPNKYVSFLNDNRTLRFTLPAIPTDSIFTGNITFQPFDINNISTNMLSGTYTIDTVGIESLGLLGVTKSLNFSINNGDIPTLYVIPSLTEQTVTTGSAKIILALSGNVTWDIVTVDKKKALIDSLIASDQADEWEKIKIELKKNLNLVNLDVSNRILTINIPKVEGYYLTKDQTVSLIVPYQVLSESVNLGKQTVTITASPKVLISGTATPSLSLPDLIKGGKTVIATLVNGVWANDISTNTSKREKLLSGFQWDSPDQSSLNAQLNAKAQVFRTSSQVVTITLPPIDGIKFSGQVSYNPGIFTYSSSNLSSYITVNAGNQDTFSTTSFKAFTVNPVQNQSAVVAGLTSVNEFDIATGGKTLTITLKNDTWVKDVETRSNQLTLSYTDGQSKYGILNSTIKRTSDTVITLTLDKPSSFDLTKDAIVNVMISEKLLETSVADIQVNSAFKILAVTANLSGTGLSLAPVDIQKGGKTIIVKLNNGTFYNYTDSNFINYFIDSFTSTGTSWNLIKAALKNDISKIKATKDTVTITLPAVPNYQSLSGETISLTINQYLVTNANKNIAADKTITIGQVASAMLTTSPTSLSELNIQRGSTITIVLNGATWDPTLVTNKSKLSALLKGFVTTDQTKEWGLISSAIQSSSAPVTIVNNDKTLIIAVPAMSNYSIIRNQILDVTIPKSVLQNYNYDISAGQLKIAVPTVSSDHSLGELLDDDFAKYIEDNGLDNIRVIVPEKKVNTITVNTIEAIGSSKKSSSITTIEITTNSDVKKLKVTTKGQNGDVTKEQNGTGKFIFVFTNIEKNSDLKVSVFGADGSDPLQQDLYVKIPSGAKTFNENPRAQLTGSYSLYSLLTDKSLISELLKYYAASELKVGIIK